MSYYTYIVECADGSYYTGWTVDVAARINTHNEGKGARYTRARGPVSLLAQWKFPSKRQAMQFEWRIKQLTRRQKEMLVAESKH